MTASRHIAIVGAGIAAATCARTLLQDGHRITVFERSHTLGGRMATRNSPFGTFDHGTQYFTVHDPRFMQAVQATPTVCKPWSANATQLLDEQGHNTAPSSIAPHEPHWVASPGMSTLAKHWLQPLLDARCIEMQTCVVAIERDSLNRTQWQLRTEGQDDSCHVYGGFDAVLLAIPVPQAQVLLKDVAQAQALVTQTAAVKMSPCWTLMLAFPQAMQPGLSALGPQWNAARSMHPRITWLCRESSKPGRSQIERWTVQASTTWSRDHLHDDAQRVQAKLAKTFAELTGIHAEPSYVDTKRWLYARTDTPLGQSHLWDHATGLGLCGDWCLGSLVEHAYVSGLELALAVAKTWEVGAG